MNTLTLLLVFFACLVLISIVILQFRYPLIGFVKFLAKIIFSIPCKLYPPTQQAVDIVFNDIIIKLFVYFSAAIFMITGLIGIVSSLIYYFAF